MIPPFRTNSSSSLTFNQYAILDTGDDSPAQSSRAQTRDPDSTIDLDRTTRGPISSPWVDEQVVDMDVSHDQQHPPILPQHLIDTSLPLSTLFSINIHTSHLSDQGALNLAEQLKLKQQLIDELDWRTSLLGNFINTRWRAA